MLIWAISSVSSFAAAVDTLQVNASDINMKSLQTGSYSYAIYYRKTKQSPAQRLTLVTINIKADTYNNKPVFVATQEWDRDTIIHRAYTVFNAVDFSTIIHNTWWKSLGYEMKFDFDKKSVDFEPNGIKGDVPDSTKTSVTNDFKASLDAYALNWHADLLVYQVLPYKEGRTFMINFIDPGFGKAEKVAYSVTGSDVLTDSRGQKIDCWLLNHTEAAGSFSAAELAKISALLVMRSPLERLPFLTKWTVAMKVS